MDIIIKTKNIELTNSLRSYINKRIEGLSKFKKNFSTVQVEIEKETNHHKKGHIFKAEAMIYLDGKNLIAKATGDDLGKAVTEVRDELKQKIKKHKLETVELPRRRIKKATKKFIS